MFDQTPEADRDWFRSMMEEMNPGTEAGKKNKLRFAESARLLMSLDHVDRILENVNHGIV
jgi:hypothetical protein